MIRNESVDFSIEDGIIAQADGWLAVNKPSNFSVHSETGIGLVAQLQQQLNLDFLAPVHRLDKVTSGILLLAKNSETAAELSQQFALRQVNKVYCAITTGKPKKKQGTIVGDMLPARRGSYRLAKTLENPARTEFFSIGLYDGLRIALLKPTTGKTHQLRVAMKSNGSPILGDPRYGVKRNADRCYLHHYHIQLKTSTDWIDLKVLPKQGEHFLAPEFVDKFSAKLNSLAWT
ncbi:MAG: RNA pseudouridine synthase [Gammaproteobacteria bacterium]|nr:RNA pseudouridine synthase [Gammaproteobacteria bacterium]